MNETRLAYAAARTSHDETTCVPAQFNPVWTATIHTHTPMYIYIYTYIYIYMYIYVYTCGVHEIKQGLRMGSPMSPPIQ